jgi:hypothetical protein
MRTMIKWTMPVERGNQAVADGTLKETFEALFEKLKPEAAYFYPEDGYRAAMMVFDMKDSSEVAQIAELLFSKLDASFHITPVMNGDDLQKGLAGLT